MRGGWWCVLGAVLGLLPCQSWAQTSVLTWNAPVTLIDHGPIPPTDPIQGYHFFTGPTPLALVQHAYEAGPTDTSVPLSTLGLGPGVCVAMAAFQAAGDGRRSNVLCIRPIAPDRVYIDVTLMGMP